MKIPSYRRTDGLSVVEVIVAAAVIVTLVTAAAGAWQLYLRTATMSTRQSQAALLIEDASEVLRIFRDQSWSSIIAPLSLATPYQLYWTGTAYRATTTQILLQDQMVRTITLSSVSRDANDNITSSGGTLDAQSRKVTISVFPVNSTSTPLMMSQMLIHNVYSN
jgi:Tfp pilus assembly protein PilV